MKIVLFALISRHIEFEPGYGQNVEASGIVESEP